MSNGKSKSFRRRHVLHIAHCSLLIGHLGSAHRRVMESLHGLSTAHWDHDPLPSKQLTIGNRQSEGPWRGGTFLFGLRKFLHRVRASLLVAMLTLFTGC